MRHIVKAAAAAAVVPLLVTACSSPSSPATPNPTASSSSASAASGSQSATSSAAGSAGDPLASLTADQIASKANADLKAASSFHVSGTITVGGSRETQDLTSESGNCKGTITIAGSSITIVLIGKTLWVETGNSGTYIKGTTTNSQYNQMIAECSPATAASTLDQSFDLTKAGTAVVDGQSVLELRNGTVQIYVTDSATPEYVRYYSPGLEQMDFTAINAPVSISPPPASEVIGV